MAGKVGVRALRVRVSESGKREHSKYESVKVAELGICFIGLQAECTVRNPYELSRLLSVPHWPVAFALSRM